MGGVVHRPWRGRGSGPEARVITAVLTGVVVLAVLVGIGLGNTSTSTKAKAVPSSAAVTATPSLPAVEPTTEPPTTEETTPSGPLALASGETADLSQDGDASTFKVRVVIKRNAQPVGEFTEPSKVGQYVVIDVTATGVTGQSHVNPFDFTAQTADGRVWQPTFAPGFDPEFNDATISAGRVNRGNVAFDIPRGAVAIELEGGYGQDAVAEWK